MTRVEEPDARLGIDVGPDGVGSRVELSGELELDSADALWTCLDGLVARGHPVLEIDLGRLEWCDSVGLSTLLRAADRCRAAGGRLIVTGATGEVAWIMAITGVDGILGAGSLDGHDR